MKIVFWGTPSFAVPSLERLLREPDCEVLGVVTQPDKRRGRGNQLQPEAVKKVALAHNLPLWQPQRVKKDAATLADLRSLAADFFVVVAYGQILSPEILAMPRLGCINNHASLLPRYRGAAPIQWSLYNGETETGITTMLMDAGMDTGAMLLQRTLVVGLLENAEQVSQRLAELGADLVVETLRQQVVGQLQPIPQDNSQATYAPLIKKEDYGLDWHKSAIALQNQIRGFYPDCQTSLRGQPLKVSATLPLGSAYWSALPPEFQALAPQWTDERFAENHPPGSVIGLAKNLGPIIQTGAGGLLLLQVQPAGKRIQSGWDFVNGARLQIGEQLGLT
uniref:Methionyl-tRNA formyltransferase n=1 Tax=Cyanothece sp. (strain PCC 7425 / ATCC 29141) TaxID=395961 RepID=FMT_CYAP4|nr:RecName: Full=Methionyl-tRNA formyltransferase [Cyanothece sp. PCC 7425]